MARINIEEDAWVRIYRLAEMVDCSVREAAGTVTCLWHQSQNFLKTIGTEIEVIEWASLHKLSDELQKKWISGLTKSRFISEEKNGTFTIHGNEIQIESRVGNMNRASKGGKALKKKWSETRRLQAGLKKASSTLKASSKQASSPSMQGNARQCNTEQSNAKQGNAILMLTEPKKSAQPENDFLAKEVWEAYRESYFSRYNEDPVRNAKVNGQIKQIIKRLGSEATEVVRFYVSHNKTYYVSKCHEIGPCLADAESLRTQWAKGRAITNVDLRRFERVVESNDLDRMISEGKI